MARKFAQIQVQIWADDDFTDLSPLAQWLYFHLSTNVDTNFCGVTDWRPKRILGKAKALTMDALLSAAHELQEAVFIVVDDDTEEVMVRSLMKYDEVLKGPNMGKPVARAWLSTASKHLRGVIVHELHRIQREHPEYKNWPTVELRDVMGKRSIDPKAVPSPAPVVIDSGLPSGAPAAAAATPPPATVAPSWVQQYATPDAIPDAMPGRSGMASPMPSPMASPIASPMASEDGTDTPFDVEKPSPKSFKDGFLADLAKLEPAPTSPRKPRNDAE